MKRVYIILFSILLLGCSASAMEDLTLKTVVIDAGHGGKDPGAVSKDGKSKEKTFTLDIAERLEALIKEKYPEVKVVLTRHDDTFISLDQRAEIANKCNADLFISIHINSAYATTSSGFSTHVLGQSSQKNRDLYKANLELVKRENSVIMLDDNYNAKQSGFDPSDPSSYIFMTMMQSAHLEQSIDFAQIINKNLKSGPITVNRGVSQDPFYVLWKTTMPAVLVELGFISNPDNLAQLKKPAQRQELARRLLLAFSEYKQQYDASTSHSMIESSSRSTESVATQAISQPVVKYGVQVLAVSSNLERGDARFLGYEPAVFPSGKIKKYVISVDESLEVVRKNFKAIKKKYPDSFIVKIEGENLSRCK